LYLLCVKFLLSCSSLCTRNPTAPRPMTLRHSPSDVKQNQEYTVPAGSFSISQKCYTLLVAYIPNVCDNFPSAGIELRTARSVA
jgi:hypothetical protein